MAIKFTPYNIFKLISTLSPFLISFFFLMSSILHQNLKGFVYLLGVILASLLNIGLLQFFSNNDLIEKEINKPISCGILDLPKIVPQTSIPCTNSIFHTFTISYLLISMKNSGEINYILLTFLSLIFVIDFVTRYMNKCTNLIGILLGSVFGGIYGVSWYTLWSHYKVKEVLYYDELTSNNVKCLKTKQKFICKKRKTLDG